MAYSYREVINNHSEYKVISLMAYSYREVIK